MRLLCIFTAIQRNYDSQMSEFSKEMEIKTTIDTTKSVKQILNICSGAERSLYHQDIPSFIIFYDQGKLGIYERRPNTELTSHI